MKMRCPIASIGSCVAAALMLWNDVAAEPFDRCMGRIAVEMAHALGCTTGTRVAVTVVDEDENYLLPLNPVHRALVRELGKIGVRAVFTGFRGKEQATVRAMVLAGGDEYEPLIVEDRQLDSLLLSGSYYLDDARSDRIHLVVTLFTVSGRRLYESDECVIDRKECPAALERQVFSMVEESRSLLELRSRVIGKLGMLFNAPNSTVLTYPPRFRFVVVDPYAVAWQVDAFKELLTLRYGIVWDDTAAAVVTVEPGGGVTFKRFGQEAAVTGLIETEPLLAVHGSADTLRYLSGRDRLTLEQRPLSTPVEYRVKAQVSELFAKRYPSLFNPFDRSQLDSMFGTTGAATVLAGRVIASDQATGREQIEYVWYRPGEWLDELEKGIRERGRTYSVKTEILALFADNLNDHRYWAIVNQEWATKDRYGADVYRDRGFLLVNLDFDAQAHLAAFRVHCRLWFYDYRYDDRETGVTRVQKLTADVQRYLVDGVGGIDKSLKQAMADYLIGAVKNGQEIKTQW